MKFWVQQVTPEENVSLTRYIFAVLGCGFFLTLMAKARGIWVPWKGNYCEKGVTDFNTRSSKACPQKATISHVFIVIFVFFGWAADKTITFTVAPRGSMHYVDYMCCVKVACQRKTYGDSAFCVISWSGTSYPQWNKLPDCPKLYKRVEFVLPSSRSYRPY